MNTQPTLFQDSMLESAHLLRSHSRLPVILSVAVQATILTAIILIPLLHPEVLPQGTPTLTELFAPAIPAPKPPAPPPVQPVHVTATSANSAAPSMPSRATAVIRGLLNIPSTARVSDAPAIPGSINLIGSTSGLPNGLLVGGPGGGTNISVIPSNGNASGTTSAKTPATVRISSGVSAGLLLSPIRPEYPAIARTTRTEGTVVIQAIISKVGRIQSAHVVAGPPLLQAAALQAVEDARYHPYLLNGQPTEVETTISITFRMAD